MKNLLLFFCLFLSIVSYSQIDSSKYYSAILTGGNSKSWYTRPEIIDNPRQIHYSTLTFKLKTKTGSLSKSGKGRDMLTSFRNLVNWKIEKLADRYALVISSSEKYFLNVTNSSERVLVLDAAQKTIKGIVNIAGHFFETPLKID